MEQPSPTTTASTTTADKLVIRDSRHQELCDRGDANDKSTSKTTCSKVSPIRRAGWLAAAVCQDERQAVQLEGVDVEAAASYKYLGLWPDDQHRPAVQEGPKPTLLLEEAADLRASNCPTNIVTYAQNRPWPSFSHSMRRRDSASLPLLCRRGRSQHL